MASSSHASPSQREFQRSGVFKALSQQRVAGEADERGAVLMIIALLLLILMLIGGLAVDVSAKGRRGQELQNAADSAALAGARIRANADEATATAAIQNMLLQNGIQLGDGVSFQVDFPTTTTVTVDVIDINSVGIFDPVTGGTGTTTRSATAEHFGCNGDCDQIIEAPGVFRSVEAFGYGDGYLPIAVGTRLYAVNHHQNGIACIDKAAQPEPESCWPGEIRRAFVGDYITQDVHNPVLIGDKIYYLGTTKFTRNSTNMTGETLRLACFDTTTNQTCNSTRDFVDEGWGTMAEVNGLLYIFTGDLKVHCVRPDFADCGGYGTGLDSHLAWLPENVAVDDEDAWSIDSTRFVKADIKVVGSQIISTVSNGGAQWVQCWDVNSTAPCATFGPYEVSVGNQNTANKVLLYRNAFGDPSDFCIIGQYTHVECWALDGSGRNTAPEAQLDKIRTAMLANGWSAGWSAASSYHEESNRVFIMDPQKSWSYCFNFINNQMCGEHYDVTALGVVETYGYIADGPRCLIGLGDESIFFSSTIDLDGPCDSSGGDTTISPCFCQGQPVWPVITAEETTDVEDMLIRVLRDDGSIVIPWTDLLLGDLEISSSEPAGTLTLEFDIRVSANTDPWADNNPPTFRLVGPETAPRLTD